MFQQTNNRWIQGIPPMLPEIGKFKIGCLDTDNPKKTKDGKTWYPPKKFDHIVVTTLERDRYGNFKKDEAIHEIIGKEPKSIPITFIYSDPELNLFTRYASFDGRRVYCSGDGITAKRTDKGKPSYEVKCPCVLLDPDYKGEDKCDFNLRLSCYITPANKTGGVWVFRSGSYLMTIGMMNQMKLFNQITAGHMAGIPFELVLKPQTSTDREGKQHTNQIVSINYNGSIIDLQEKVRLQLAKNSEFYHDIKMLEDRQKEQIVVDDMMFPEHEQDEYAQEFYPQQEEQVNTDTGEITQPEKPKRKKEPKPQTVEVEDAKEIPDLKNPMEGIETPTTATVPVPPVETTAAPKIDDPDEMRFF